MTSQLSQVSQIYELERQYLFMWEVEVTREAKNLMVGNVQNLGKVIVNVPVRVENSIL